MRRMIAVATAAVLAATLAACGGGRVRGSDSDQPAVNASPAAGDTSPAESSGAGTSDSTKTAQPSGTFVYSYHLNVVTDWDPATSYSNEIIAMENIYESLTHYDPATGKVLPGLATRWEESDGGATWTFTLRSDVTFHTGRAMDAQAAKDAIERTIKLKGGPAYIWDSVKSIEAPSATTLVFRLKYPAPLDLISSSAYAAYIYDTKAAGSGDLVDWFNKGQDAGTGPYTVASWTKGADVELRLKAYDKYWGGWKSDNYQQVEFRVTPQVTTAWQLLQSGDVDFVDRLNPQLFAQAQKVAAIQTTTSASFQNLLALYNTADGPMSNVKVRKAIQDAIDTKGLLAALKGADGAASGVVPEGLLGYTDGLQLTQNLEEAKTLLAEAGYGPDGKKLTLTLTYAQGDDDQQLFVTLLTSALSQLGVTLQATPMQWSAQWDQAKSTDTAKRQDIFVMYWYPDYADAYSWFANVFHSADPPYFNLTYLRNAQVDKKIDEIPELTATDKGKAESVYQELNKTLVQDLAVVAPLFVEKYERALAGDVKGYVDNPAYPDVVFVHELTHS